MKKFNLFIAGCTLSLLSINPSAMKAQIPIQYPEYTFEKKFDVLNATSGDCRSHWDEVARASAQDNNNNDYYFTGGYLQSGSNCVQIGHGLIMKTNERGEQQWAKRIINSGYYNDIKCVYDGNTMFTGLVAAGSTYNSTGTTGHYELVKTDVDGNLLYHKQYVSYGGVCNKVQQVRNLGGNVEGFIAVGTLSNNHIYVVRVEDDLDIMWDKEIYLPNVNSSGYSVIQTADKGFLITGTLGGSIWVIKLDYAGIMRWKKAYTISNNSLSGKDAVEVMNGGNSEYYILGNTTDASSDLVVLKIDAGGGRLNDSKIDLGAQDLASGLVFVTGGYLTISGTSNGSPVLFKVDCSTLSTFSFSKKYANCQNASPVIKANDAGYVLCGTNYQGPLSIIKTLDDGVSECNETEPQPSAIVINLSETTTLPDSLLRGVSSPSYGLGNINLAETTVCANYCRAVITSYTQTTRNVCFQLPGQLTINYVPGTVLVEWYESTNLNNIIYTGAIFTVSLSANTSYVVRSYSADGCLLSEVTVNVIVSPAPVAYAPIYVTACYGENLTLPNPCSLGNTAQWTNPPGQTGDAHVRVFASETFTVNCLDAYGCLLGTYEYGVSVSPTWTMTVTYTKCDNELLVLDNLAYNTYNWVDQNQLYVSGTLPFNPGPGTHHYFGTREDVNGCISYIEVILDIMYCLPVDPPGGHDRMANPSIENVAVHTVGLYPNPATNAVQVSVSLGKEETFSLQVVDMLGKTVINLQRINEGELSLDIAELPAGVYQVEISVGGEIIRKKLVKQ